MAVAMSPSAACVSCRSARVWPNMRRDLARANPSSSALRAKPSAAAATDARKMSSVIMASLNPCPASPSRCVAGMRQLSNVMVASGCGAISSIRSLTSNPGVSASTTKALMPRAPGASPVRANTQ
ncbi:hypothetical protein D3C86_1469340 [compost metagenome]